MSQITCCPNCSTSFRVTDAQLAAHQGKVRCGRCAFVFYAPDFVQTLNEAAPISAPVPTPDPVATQPAPAPMLTPAQVSPETKAAQPKQNKGIASKDNTEKASIDIPSNTNAKKALTQLAKEEQALELELDKNEALLEEVEPSAQHNTVPTDRSANYQPILNEDEFFNPTPTHSKRTWLWASASLLVLLLLIAQSAYVFRQQLTQEFPALRPKYLALCAKLNCTLPLPREAQLLRSEYSELTFIPNNPNLIQLNATLRNLAPFAQELPRLELTLTDENEKVIVRKIFTAKQYLIQNERVQNSIEANEEIRAFLQLDLAGLHSTGYSLYWFY